MYPFLKKWVVVFSTLILVAVAGMAAVAGALLAYIQSLPPLTTLENYSPPEISRFYDRTGSKVIGEYFSERREVVRYKDVPQHLINAFISIEDERFADHFGVDLKGLIRALKVNITGGGKHQGASTITMQVARNVVLQDRTKRFARKLREIVTALQIERYYSKEQILEFYMNEIYFGSQAYGVQAASRRFFNKDVKDLTVPEAAVIAGMPKAPTKLSPLVNPVAAKERRDTVLAKMRQLGYISSDDELLRYQATPIVTNSASRTLTEYPYFTNYAANVVMKQNNMRTVNDLGEKGFSVVTSVDVNLQKILEEELRRHLVLVERKIEEQKSGRLGMTKPEQPNRLARIKSVGEDHLMVTYNGLTGRVPLPKALPYFEPEKILRPGNLIDIRVISTKNGKLEAALYDTAHVQGGAVLLDAHTGEILALAGGADYNDGGNNGQWNRAVQGGRQPGSCWKPLLYASALDALDAKGHSAFTPASVLEDSPITIGGWSPKNYEGRFSGPTSLFEALVKSRNVPTVNLFMAMSRLNGRQGLMQLYRRFNTADGPTGWALSPDPPMCLGTPNVTPLQLASAYAVFANGGIGITPTPIKRIASGKTGDTRLIRPAQSQVLTPQAAYMITRILEDVVSRGTAAATIGAWRSQQNAKGRKIPEIAGKTGTTNDCFVAWFTGYTPDLVLAVYVGFDQHRSMGPKMVGGGTVGPIWVSMMDRILKTRQDWKQKFDIPSGLELRDICSKSGLRATGACSASGAKIIQNVAFKAGTAPNGSCYHTFASSNDADGTEEMATDGAAPN